MRTQAHRDRDLAEGRIEELRAVVRDLTAVLEKRNAALLEIMKLDDSRCDEAPLIARRALGADDKEVSK